MLTVGSVPLLFDMLIEEREEEIRRWNNHCSFNELAKIKTNSFSFSRSYAEKERMCLTHWHAESRESMRKRSKKKIRRRTIVAS